MHNFIKVYLLCALSNFLSISHLCGYWHDDLKNAIKKSDDYNALNIIEAHKDEIRTAPLTNVLNRRTILHEAAVKGRTGIVRELIHNGANVAAQDSFDFTPFDYALFENHFDVAQVMIDHARVRGIDLLNIRDKQGLTTWHRVSRNTQIVGFLNTQGIIPNVDTISDSNEEEFSSQPNFTTQVNKKNNRTTEPNDSQKKRGDDHERKARFVMPHLWHVHSR